jgi:hypothetical protein
MLAEFRWCPIMMAELEAGVVYAAVGPAYKLRNLEVNLKVAVGVLEDVSNA